MRAVIQRVSRAQVTVDGQVVGTIGEGLCVLAAAGSADSERDLRYIAEKTANLRIFEDGEGKMNRSVLEVGGGVLLISQFTLYGDVRRGRRPSFTAAMEPGDAEKTFCALEAAVREAGVTQVETGTFRAMMNVELVNTGPVTILLDSEKKF